jgi:predicted ATP-dependent endonuclease of OLD family
MYLESLKLRNIKLIEEARLDFTESGGGIRKWTVLLGDNGLCKSTILQAVALAAAGPKLGSSLVRDASVLHRALVQEPGLIDAEFVPAEVIARGRNGVLS